MDIGDILKAAAEPGNVREASTRILLDQRLETQRRELTARLEREVEEFAGEVTKPQEVLDLAKQITELEQAIVDAEVEFKFRALPYQEWMDLIAKHPPTKAQRDLNPYADNNPDTFQPAAIAACCYDPEMTVDDAKEMRRLLPWDSFTKLAACATAVNRNDHDPKAPLAGLILRRRDGFVKRATTTGPRGPSSSVASEPSDTDTSTTTPAA